MGIMKLKGYQTNARNLIGLRERITEEVQLLTQPMVERVPNRFSQRLEQCRLVQGHQLRDVIKKLPNRDKLA